MPEPIGGERPTNSEPESLAAFNPGRFTSRIGSLSALRPEDLAPADAALFAKIFAQTRQGSPFAHYLGRHAESSSVLSDLQQHAEGLVRSVAKDRILSAEDAMVAHACVCTSALLTMSTLDQNRIRDQEHRTTYFLTQVGIQLAWQVENPQGEDAAIHDFILQSPQISQRLGEALITDREWVDQKFNTFANALASRNHIEALVAQEPIVELSELEQARKASDDLMRQLRRLQRHSIKSAVHQGSDVSWSIHDTFDFSAGLVQLVQEAGTDIRSDEWMHNIRMIALEHPTENEAGVRSILFPQATTELQRLDPGVLYRTCFVDDRGDVYLDPYRTIPASLVYERYNKPDNYEVLRGFLLGDFFDLAVPEQVYQESQWLYKQQQANQPQGREEPYPIRALMTARTQALRSYKTINAIEALEQEEPDNPEIRVLRGRHEVVRRHKLNNPEHRAGVAARELAAEMGIELDEHETLALPPVKVRKRG